MIEKSQRNLILRNFGEWKGAKALKNFFFLKYLKEEKREISGVRDLFENENFQKAHWAIPKVQFGYS